MSTQAEIREEVMPPWQLPKPLLAKIREKSKDYPIVPFAVIGVVFCSGFVVGSAEMVNNRLFPYEFRSPIIRVAESLSKR